jgi:RNA polymerase sigma-54 factor
LLQIPTAELAARIEEELEDNPALEEGLDHNEEQEPRETLDDLEREEMEVGDYLQDEYAGYKMAGDSYDPNEETRERPLATESSTQEYLLNQIRYVVRTEREEILAQQIIGS